MNTPGRELRGSSIMPQKSDTPRVRSILQETHITPARTHEGGVGYQRGTMASNDDTREKVLESSKQKVDVLKTQLEGMLFNIKHQSSPQTESERRVYQSNVALIEERLKKAAETELTIDAELAALRAGASVSNKASLAQQSTTLTASIEGPRTHLGVFRGQKLPSNSESKLPGRLFSEDDPNGSIADSQDSMGPQSSHRQPFNMEISEESMRKSIFEESRRDEQRKARFSNHPKFEDEDEYRLVDHDQERGAHGGLGSDLRDPEQSRHARSQEGARRTTVEPEAGLPKPSPFSDLCPQLKNRGLYGWTVEPANTRPDREMPQGSDRKIYRIIRHPFPSTRNLTVSTAIQEESKRHDVQRDEKSLLGSVENPNLLEGFIDLGIHKNLATLGSKRQLGSRDHHNEGIYDEISRTLGERNEKLYKLNCRNVLASRQLTFCSARQTLCFPEFKDSSDRIRAEFSNLLKKPATAQDDDCDSTESVVSQGVRRGLELLKDGFPHLSVCPRYAPVRRHSLRSGAASIASRSVLPRPSGRL